MRKIAGSLFGGGFALDDGDGCHAARDSYLSWTGELAR
jgi:hypothetical protein